MATKEQDQWLRSVCEIDPAGYQKGPVAHPQPAKQDATLGKARQVWLATRGKVERDVTALQGKVAEAYKGHDMAQELESAFAARVEPLLRKFDDRLVHALDAIATGTDAQRPSLTKAARAIIASYEQYLDADDVIDHLDKNPVMPIAIRKTLETVLDNLARALG